MKILIVEDHEGTGEILAATLRRCDGITTVTLAKTLAAGIEQSVLLRPDITLLDLLLPDSPSWQDTITAIPKFHPPVIVVTELECPEARVAAFKAGAEDFIQKHTVLRITSILIAAIASAKMRRMAQEERRND